MTTAWPAWRAGSPPAAEENRASKPRRFRMPVKGSVSLVSVSQPVIAVLELARLDRVFPIYPSLAEAPKA